MSTENTTINATTTDIPTELATLVQAGTAALDDGDLRTALEKFETVVNAFPEQPEGHNNLGALYSSMGDYKKAEQCFTKVVDLLPDNPNVLYNRGVVRSHLRRFSEAKADFTAVLTMIPNDPDALNNLGVAAYLEGNFDEARGHFISATTARPDFINATLNHIDLECSAGNLPQAIAMCEAHLATNASTEIRRKHLELLSTNCLENLSKATQTAESILVIDKDNDAVREELGRITQARAAWTNTATIQNTNASEASM